MCQFLIGTVQQDIIKNWFSSRQLRGKVSIPYRYGTACDNLYQYVNSDQGDGCQFLIGTVQPVSGGLDQEKREERFGAVMGVSIPYRYGTAQSVDLLIQECRPYRLCQFLIGTVQLENTRQVKHPGFGDYRCQFLIGTVQRSQPKKEQASEATTSVNSL